MKEALETTLEEYKSWIEQTADMIDYDEAEYIEKQRYLDIWNTAYRVLAEWELNLLIYDTYQEGFVREKREALNIMKSTYSKYMQSIRRKIRNELGVKPPLKNNSLIEYNERNDIP